MKTKLTFFILALSTFLCSGQVYLQSGFNISTSFGLIEKPYQQPELEYPAGMHTEVGANFKSKWQIGVFYQFSEAQKSIYLFPEEENLVPSNNKTLGLHPSIQVFQRTNETIKIWFGVPLYLTEQNNSWRTGIYDPYNPHNYCSGTDHATFFSIGLAPTMKLSPQGRNYYFYLTPSYSFHSLQKSGRHIFIEPTIGEVPELENNYIESSFQFNFGFGYLF